MFFIVNASSVPFYIYGHCQGLMLKALLLNGAISQAAEARHRGHQLPVRALPQVPLLQEDPQAPHREDTPSGANVIKLFCP
jgi:hypothetical protein